ncbi:ribonuclease Z [Amphibacillus sp. Q70]|uniref:ribonuclease Z n=1 Tax=Amphibacillus sp. Q70 TaxID=3453416 RepID=UPI003F84654E
MKITFLGTGAGLPAKHRNVSAIALHLMEEYGSIWLFDCGEATQHQILHTSIRPRKIEKIFITHLHGDHIYGLPGLLSSRSFQEGTTPLTVYGPVGIEQFIKTSLTISGTQLSYPLHVVEIFDGYQLDEAHFMVDVIALEHGIDSFGYRISEKNQIGKLQVDKLKALGIQPGPIYQQIKTNEVTELPDGQHIYRKDVVGPTKKGRKVTIFGDTRHPMQFVDFVYQSDLLIHEATFHGDNQDLADQYFHSTNIEAAQLAKQAKVKQLALTHISARYRDEDLAGFLAEAQTIFPATILAEDFLTTEITKALEN